MTKRTTRPRRVKALEATISRLRLPVWSLPRTAAAYDAMVEQMTVAAAARLLTSPVVHTRAKELVRPDIIVALRAIGIVRPRDTSAQVRRKRNTTNSQETLDNAMADWVSSYPRD